MPTSSTAPKRETREMPMRHLEAEIRAVPAGEGEAPAENEFEVVLSTGATVRREIWWSGKRYDEELVIGEKAVRTARLNGGASVLNSHRSWDLGDVIGAMVRGSVKIVKGELVGRVRIDDGPETAAILRKIKNGFVRYVSVGYVVHRYTKIEREGQPELWRAEEWEPYELSFVPIPADAGASVRSGERRTFPCEFINHQRKEETMSKKVIENDDNEIEDAEVTEAPQARSAKEKATRAKDPDPTQEPTSPPDDAAVRAAVEVMMRVPSGV